MSIINCNRCNRIEDTDMQDNFSHPDDEALCPSCCETDTDLTYCETCDKWQGLNDDMVCRGRGPIWYQCRECYEDSDQVEFDFA